MSAAPNEDGVRPLRVILREFVRNVVEGEDEVDRAALIEYAIKRFEGDLEFGAAAARDVIPVAIPEVLRDVVSSLKSSVMETPSGTVSRKKLDLTAKERLAKVFEGTGGGYKCFLNESKRDLLRVNAQEIPQLETRQRWVEFRADLAARMDDIRTVGDTFSGVELDQVWRRHFDPKKDD